MNTVYLQFGERENAWCVAPYFSTYPHTVICESSYRNNVGKIRVSNDRQDIVLDVAMEYASHYGAKLEFYEYKNETH